jgi:hypothetical protein
MAKQTRAAASGHFPYSKRPTIPLDQNHRLVVIADEIDWTELLERGGRRPGGPGSDP